MQVCDQCGACREPAWRTCPFCRSELDAGTTATTTDSEHFNALAAASERHDSDVLPSPVQPEPESETDSLDAPLTEADLAHLTGQPAPDTNGWQSPKPPTPFGSDDNEEDSVSRLVVVPLIAAAIMAVAFVGYSIVTQAPAERPDAVALIDRSTTTVAPTTTTTEPLALASGAVPIGIDIAEQAERLCRGDQFSIARATEASTALYNDVMVAVQDGVADWSASPDQEMLRGPVPPLVGCLQTADAGEIDRCPNAAVTISRRSVSWSYRVLRTIDGVEVGADSGTASDVRPCDELEPLAAGSDYGSWSPLPQDRFDAVSSLTSAPHPEEACRSFATAVEANQTGTAPEPAPIAPPAEDPVEPTEAPWTSIPAMHATAYGVPRVDLDLPEGYGATPERPVEAVLCLMRGDDVQRVAFDEAEVSGVTPSTEVETSAADDPATPQKTPPAASCDAVTIVVMDRFGGNVAAFEYPIETCPSIDQLTVPFDFLEEVIAVELGFVPPEPDPAPDVKPAPDQPDE